MKYSLFFALPLLAGTLAAAPAGLQPGDRPPGFPPAKRRSCLRSPNTVPAAPSS